MNIIDGIDFDQYLEDWPEQADIKPAFVQVYAVVDYFHGDQVQRGINMPWSKTHGKFRIRPGEVTIWAGVNGTGKSLILNQIILQAMSQGETACIASMEMNPHVTMARMTRQASGTNLPPEPFIKAFHKWTDGKLWLYTQQNTVKPERIIAVLRYLHSAMLYEGKRIRVNHFVIDSFMKCGIKMDDYNRQASFINELHAIAKDTGIHIHIVAHARKSDNSTKMVDKFDIKGASEITDQVDNVITVWRNKRKEDESVKSKQDQQVMLEPDSMLICSKQRHGEWEGKIALWFHTASMQFVTSDGARPIEFFKYSRDTYEDFEELT